MNAKQLSIFAALMMAVCVTVILMHDGSTRAADRPKQVIPKENLRYEVLQSNGRPMYLFDTATGRMWNLAYLGPKADQP